MGEVPLRFLRGILQAIPRPVNQILQATPTATVTKDGCHLILRMPLNSDRVRGQLSTGIT